MLYRCLPRNLKAYSSSSLESLILSCSMPNDKLPPEIQISGLLRSIHNLDSSIEESSGSGRSSLHSPHYYSPSSHHHHEDTISTVYEVIVRKTLRVMFEGSSDWRSAAKACYTLHRLLKGCGRYQSKLVAELFLARLPETKAHLQLVVTRLKNRRNSNAYEGWDWVGSYLRYLQALSESTRHDVHSLQYSLMLDGPSNLLALSNTLFDAGFKVLGRQSDSHSSSSSSLLRALKAQCSSLIADDVSNLVRSLRMLEYPVVREVEEPSFAQDEGREHEYEKDSDEESSEWSSSSSSRMTSAELSAQAEELRRNLRDVSISCFQHSSQPSIAFTKKSPLLPTWIQQM